jgi:uncharacterized protein with ATP-grasp and redox domains
MKYFADCFTCYMNQIHRALRLLSPGIEERKVVDAQHTMMKFISQCDLDKTNNISFGTEVYRVVAETLGVRDPYKTLKIKFNQIALDLYPKLILIVKNSKNHIFTAIQMSIMGNAIDFGTSEDINIEKELNALSKQDLGGKVNIDNFIQSIKKAKKILVIGDNTGEIVFDRIMIEQILEEYPNKQIYYAVRRGPIINDSTLEDAKFVGMDKICPIVETSASPGLIVNKSTQKFIETFNQADLIISKGQGNFEAIVDENTSWTEVYFLLKAKCKVMETIFHVPIGTLLLVKKDVNLIERAAIEH